MGGIIDLNILNAESVHNHHTIRTTFSIDWSSSIDTTDTEPYSLIDRDAIGSIANTVTVLVNILT